MKGEPRKPRYIRRRKPGIKGQARIILYYHVVTQPKEAVTSHGLAQPDVRTLSNMVGRLMPGSSRQLSRRYRSRECLVTWYIDHMSTL